MVLHSQDIEGREKVVNLRILPSQDDFYVERLEEGHFQTSKGLENRKAISALKIIKILVPLKKLGKCTTNS